MKVKEYNFLYLPRSLDKVGMWTGLIPIYYLLIWFKSDCMSRCMHILEQYEHAHCTHSIKPKFSSHSNNVDGKCSAATHLLVDTPWRSMYRNIILKLYHRLPEIKKSNSVRAYIQSVFQLDIQTNFNSTTQNIEFAFFLKYPHFMTLYKIIYTR